MIGLKMTEGYTRYLQRLGDLKEALETLTRKEKT